MNGDTTIPLPGGWSLRNIYEWPGQHYALCRPDGEKMTRGFGREDARAFAEAMNAALAAPTTHPSAAGQPVGGSRGVATEAMRRAGARAFAGGERYARDYEYVDAQLAPKFGEVWSAMLAAAPTPPATASGCAAVTVEEVERLVDVLAAAARCDVPDQYGSFHQANTDDYVRARNDVSAAIRNLAAPQANDGVREALADPADAYDAGYHEGEAYGRKEAKAEIERLTELADKFKWQVIDTCKRAEKAEAERDALKTAATADKPGREGEGSDGWQPAATAPEGIPLRVRSRRFGWHATAKLVRYCDDEDAGRFSATSWDILHYNGDTLFRGFYGTGDMEWAPSPAPRQDGEPEVEA